MICECCGEAGDDRFNPIAGQSINNGTNEKVYMLCQNCREKLMRIVEGHSL